jgi:hypothetical protein
MNPLRKLQLLSAVVIANGLLALTAMSPQEAQAASCSSTTTCVPSIICYLPEAYCAPPSGCQFASRTCGRPCGPSTVPYNWMTCNYAPI